jgi:hypothetical protein
MDMTDLAIGRQEKSKTAGRVEHQLDHEFI